jgi:pimeloyl-ACP methyl ester carboxylesterase
VTIVWSEKDRIFPPAVHDPVARERVPQARLLVLRDVGHVPMIDDPAETARVIAASVTMH